MIENAMLEQYNFIPQFQTKNDIFIKFNKHAWHINHLLYVVRIKKLCNYPFRNCGTKLHFLDDWKFVLPFWIKWYNRFVMPNDHSLLPPLTYFPSTNQLLFDFEKRKPPPQRYYFILTLLTLSLSQVLTNCRSSLPGIARKRTALLDPFNWYIKRWETNRSLQHNSNHSYSYFYVQIYYLL